LWNLEALGGLIPCLFSKLYLCFSFIKKGFKVLLLYFLYLACILYKWFLHKLLNCWQMTLFLLSHTDINECQFPKTHHCPTGSKCIDTDGGYMCHCNLFHRGKDCRPIIPMTVVALLGEHKSHHKLIRFFSRLHALLNILISRIFT
jgi:hypothetical protein